MGALNHNATPDKKIGLLPTNGQDILSATTKTEAPMCRNQDLLAPCLGFTGLKACNSRSMFITLETSL